MALGWLYFKDHKVEWDHLRDTGQGFQTKAQVLKYVEDHWPKFKTRFKLLEQQKTRGEHGCNSETDPSRRPFARKRYDVVGNRHFPTVGP